MKTKKSTVIVNNMRIPKYEKNEEGWKIVDYDYYKVNYLNHCDENLWITIVVNNVVTPLYICLHIPKMSPKDTILSAIGWYIENGNKWEECDEKYFITLSEIPHGFKDKVIHSILPISTELKRDRLTKFKLVRESELIIN